MSSVYDMAEEDSESFKRDNATDADKARVARLAEELDVLTKQQAQAEQLLDDIKANKRRLEEQDLPEAMDKVGMAEFKLLDGTKVSIKPFYSASIPADRKEEAFNWLEDQGHGGIIKAEVKVAFGKGQLEFVEQFMAFARGFNEVSVSPEFTRGVHAQTLKAFVREMVESGSALPLDMFGAYIGRKASVKYTK